MYRRISIYRRWENSTDSKSYLLGVEFVVTTVVFCVVIVGLTAVGDVGLVVTNDSSKRAELRKTATCMLNP